MADEQKAEQTAQDYIDTIKNLKENTVSKEDYDKLKGEKASLLKALAEGGSSTEEPAQTKVDLNELRKELFSPESNFSNLEFTTKALKLREEVMKAGGLDPFLPQGENIHPTYSDTQAAQRVAEGLQYCVDEADGDETAFQTLFVKILR